MLLPSLLRWTSNEQASKRAQGSRREYDFFRRLAAMSHLFSMSGSFEEALLELYAAGARGDKSLSLPDKVDSQLDLCEPVR